MTRLALTSFACASILYGGGLAFAQIPIQAPTQVPVQASGPDAQTLADANIELMQSIQAPAQEPMAQTASPEPGRIESAPKTQIPAHRARKRLPAPLPPVAPALQIAPRASRTIGRPNPVTGPAQTSAD